MTAHELGRILLAGPDVPVRMVYNYGDRQKTDVAPEVTDVNKAGRVRYSAYHEMSRVVAEDDDPADDYMDAVLLSGVYAMSSHVWDVKRFDPRTVSAAKTTLLAVVPGGGKTPSDWDLTFRFVGYYIEGVRQKGGSSGQPKTWYLAASRRGFRFAAGRNADNYHAAGVRLLADAYGMMPDTPAYMLADRICDVEGWA